MGYFLTTEPETAVPANSRLSPKTHTPASPVKERGYRFYNPEVGRWQSRDPLGEWATVNLYMFCNNGPVRLYDVNGLSITCSPGGLEHNCPGNNPPVDFPMGQSTCTENESGESRGFGRIFEQPCKYLDCKNNYKAGTQMCRKHKTCTRIDANGPSDPGGTRGSHPQFLWMEDPNPTCGPCS